MRSALSCYVVAIAMILAYPSMAQSDSIPGDEEDVYLLLIGQADEAINEERYQDAVNRLTEAMAVRPDSPTNVLLLSNLGLIYSAIGQDSLALLSLNRAHEMAPAMVTVLENRARLHLKMVNDAEAFADYEKVLELDSLNTTARYYHGMIALSVGKTDIAGRDFDILYKLVPDLEFTQIAMAYYHSTMRHYGEAIPYYKKLIEMDPALEYFAPLAECYLAVGNLSDASQTLAEGLKRFPEDAELYYYRAWLNRDRYLLKEARADAKTAVELGADPHKVEQLFKK